jgi:ArsR family transcriptional regulator
MVQTPVPLPDGTVADLDALFRGFADPRRLRILNVLAAGELCVGDIVDVLGLPQPAVSRHLGYLRRTGLVGVTREWNVARYCLAEATHPVHRNLLDCVRSCFRGIRSLDRERARAKKCVRTPAGAASIEVASGD